MGASQSAAAAHEAKATRKGRVLIFQDDKVPLFLMTLTIIIISSLTHLRRSKPTLSMRWRNACGKNSLRPCSSFCRSVNVSRAS
jgi:hypothetical protein